MTLNIILIAVAFVLGSIPFGIITAKAKGVDLKKVGSGNIGATNVLRSLGKWPAIITLLGDILKGVAAVAIGKYWGVEPLYEGIIGLAAILGHNFSIFLGFRGGKGVATSIGVLLIYIPFGAFATLITWIIVVLTTRLSSLGAIAAFSLLPLIVALTNSYHSVQFVISLFISFLIIARHKDNIRRLLNGTERKIGQRE